jgi:hypothetical protein
MLASCDFRGGERNLGAERYFMLSRSSLHSASAIVSTVSQGTQDFIRINIAMAFFLQMNNSSVRVVCAYNSFSKAHFLRGVEFISFHGMRSTSQIRGRARGLRITDTSPSGNVRVRSLSTDLNSFRVSGITACFCSKSSDLETLRRETLFVFTNPQLPFEAHTENGDNLSKISFANQ